MKDNQDEKFDYVRILWGIIRRHPDYISFCEKYKFNECGWLIINDENYKDAEKIIERFGLEAILHYKVEADIHKLSCIFKTATRAATRVSGDFDNLPETHIRVEIDTRAPFSEIIKDIKFWLKLREMSRKATQEVLQKNFEENDRLFCRNGKSKIEPKADYSYFIQKFKPEPIKEAFKVWDLYQEGMRNREIAEILWPDEYKKACTNYEENRKEIYQELIDKYKKAGFEDFDEKAYVEAYGKDYENIEGESEMNRLLKRVEDKKSRMLTLLKMY